MIGLSISCAIGLGGAAGARHLADRVELPAKQSFSSVRPLSALNLADAKFEVKAFATDGTLRVVNVDDVLPRPTGIVTTELEGYALLEMGDVRVRASREAHVMFNAPGKTLKAYVNKGRVLVHRAAGIDVIVPDENLTVSGTSFGVWVQDGRTLIAVIDGEAKVNVRGTINTYAQGREIIVTDDGSTFAVIPDKLLVYIDEAEDLGGRFQVTGKTNPYAQLMVRRGDYYESVDIQPSGIFVTELARNEPATDELIAFDAVGRRAEVVMPSEDLAAVRKALVVSTIANEVSPTKTVGNIKVDSTAVPATEAGEADLVESATKTPESRNPEETEAAETDDSPSPEEEAAPAKKEVQLDPSPVPVEKAAAATIKAAEKMQDSLPVAAPAETKPVAKPAPIEAKPAPKPAPIKAKPAPKPAPAEKKIAPKPATTPKKAAPPAKKKANSKKKKSPPKKLDLSDDDLELEWD